MKKLARLKMKKPVRYERDIEKSFVRKVRDAQGFKTRKMNGEGQRNWPDQMILSFPKFVAFIEFKRPGETSTPAQKEKQEELRTMGFPVSEQTDASVAFNWVRDEWIKYQKERGK